MVMILASEDGGAASAGQLIKRYLYLWLFTDLPLIIAGRLMSVRVAFIIDLIILRLTASSLKNRKLVTFKWKKQSAKMAKARITGYQIQLATDGNFTKNKRTKTVKGYRNTSKKVTNLKAKKKYYIRIRTYKKTGKKTYWSKWSKLQTVTP